MSCQFATPISSNANSCGLNLYGGIPSKGVCSVCIENGQNNKEFAYAQNDSSNLTITQMVNSFSDSMTGWAKGGFPTTNKNQLFSRMEICKSCEFWEGSGFAGTGKCKKCGCSTQAKLRMATSKCPIDKWGPVDVVKTD